jgi:hypothetical protein
MRTRRANFFAVIAFMVACGGEAYNQPAAGSYEIGNYQLRVDDTLLPVHGAAVTLEFFESAGIKPLVGRFFIEGDQRASPSLVLSHELWAGHFASSPTVVGRTLEIDGHAATVVGIAPQGFTFPESAQLWIPSSAPTPRRAG